jgi:hypothetical protein
MSRWMSVLSFLSLFFVSDASGQLTRLGDGASLT